MNTCINRHCIIKWTVHFSRLVPCGLVQCEHGLGAVCTQSNYSVKVDMLIPLCIHAGIFLCMCVSFLPSASNCVPWDVEWLVLLLFDLCRNWTRWACFCRWEGHLFWSGHWSCAGQKPTPGPESSQSCESYLWRPPLHHHHWGIGREYLWGE